MVAASGAPATLPGAAGTVPGDIMDPRIDGADYFYVVVNPGSLAAGASGSDTYQVDSAFNFYWIATTYASDIGGAAQLDATIPIPLITLTIYDGGSRRQLMNDAVPLNSIASCRASEPYRLIRPRLFVANSTVKFSFTNYSTSTTYSNTYLVLHGYSILVGAKSNG